LRERLILLGDFPADIALAQGERYGPPLTSAVQRFQERHGLEADGVLGKQTLAALNLPLAARIRQIELSLERLRWLRDLPGGPLIAVNIPSYKLLAFDAGPASAQPALEMRVIVGQAMRTQTPVFIGDMRYIEFNPYWNVPRSIERAEIIPKLARDARYLEKNGMELVAATGAAKPAGAVSRATLAALRSGQLRVRQRPGPKNALGGVKFAFPNDMNIYLHSTPARELFSRSRRDFSHGCIRVENPLALAQYALRAQPEWTQEKIEAALAPGKTRTVRLAQPIPVLIFYTTAIADHQGRVLFLEDVYRLDQALDGALRARSAALARTRAAYP
jgi:L,D-transpeptidase YcbB